MDDQTFRITLLLFAADMAAENEFAELIVEAIPADANFSMSCDHVHVDDEGIVHELA